MVNVHPYTVQCVLPINLYNESIYVFLWYWMILVAALSVFRSDSLIAFLIGFLFTPISRIKTMAPNLSHVTINISMMTRYYSRSYLHGKAHLTCSERIKTRNASIYHQ